MFYRGTVIFFFYVDDGIYVLSNPKKVDEAIQELKDPTIELNIDD